MKLARERLAQQRQLGLVAHLVRSAGRRVPFGSVRARVEILTPGEYEPVEPIESEAWRLHELRDRRYDEGHASRGRDALHVTLRGERHRIAGPGAEVDGPPVSADADQRGRMVSRHQVDTISSMAATAIPALVFRDCVGEFATGVTIVTAEADGQAAGMTLNSFTSVSLDPLLILVSLGHGSRTLSATTKSGCFTVSILHRGQRHVAIDFADRGAPFAAEHVRRNDGGFLAVNGAAAVLCCRVVDTLRAGDHDLVLGEVVRIEHGGGEPLLFYRGRFGGIHTDAVVPAGHPIALDEGAGW